MDEDNSFIDDVLGSIFIIVLVFSKNVICDSFLIVESTLIGELWTDDLLFWGLVVVSIETFSRTNSYRSWCWIFKT